MSTLDETIDAVAAGPKSVGNKAENATSQSLADLIAVKKFQDANSAIAATGGNGLGIKIMQIVPSGATR